MKTYILTASIFLSSFAATAQLTPKDSISKVLVNEVCIDIQKKDFTKLNEEEIQTEIGMVIIGAYMKHKSGLDDILDLDMSDAEGMQQFGQEIGMKLVSECPEFLKMFMDLKKGSGSKLDLGSITTIDTVYSDAPKNEGKIDMVTGKFVKLVSGEFSHFLIKSKDGKTEKIWWMGFFAGADKLNDKSIAGKDLKVSYQEREVYNATLKEYIKIKVATQITVL